MLLVLVAVVLVVVVLVGVLVVRERRVFRGAGRDRPATLEGGGSHLTVRKGK